MRLLRLEDCGRFSLEEFIGNHLPPYAILSHTWGRDEVTFEELTNGTGTNKEGFAKILFCANQARKDDLRYCWIDTCCINKSSSSELSEAINSMFCWYRKATKCYVFLSDVSKKNEDESDHLARSTWKSAFRESRWFTRGWTLQELIAPTSVEFFSLEGIRLCDRKSMEQQIHEITNIAIGALRGDPLSTFSFDERMLWAAKRNTTRGEDQAYSLLGIFDIQIPLIYGEGKEKALARLQRKYYGSLRTPLDPRLQEIRQWLSSLDPSLNYEKALKQRQADTGLWFLESDNFAEWKRKTASFLWLHGIPGCGKTILSSTILHHVFEYCGDDTGRVVAYFYFDFKDAQKQVPEFMIRSLMSQLLRQCQMPSTLKTLLSWKDETRQPTVDALLLLLHEMILESPQVYVILDALDECADRAVLMEILENIVGWRLENLHIVVTSRKEQEIESSLEPIVDPRSMICLETKLVDADIKKYVHQKLSDDKRLRKWNKDPDIRHEIETRLMDGAHGMFRWAVCQLDTLGKCCNRSQLRNSLATLPPTLDETYNRILCAINDTNSEYAICIFRWLTFSCRPLLIDEISEIIAIDPERDPAFDSEEILEDPSDVLGICSSLITINTTEERTMMGSETRTVVALAHYSVKEYLVSDRCRQSRAAQYSMQHIPCNDFIAKCCLRYLLEVQVCDLVRHEILSEFKLFEYSAYFWIVHTRVIGQITEPLNHLISKLFSPGNEAYARWVAFVSHHDGQGNPWTSAFAGKLVAETVPNPLYCASFGGLVETVRQLTFQSKGVHVNAQEEGTKYSTALAAASAEGHLAVVELLLNRGADVNAQGGKGKDEEYYNALQAASLNGHFSTVKLLLDRGADINTQRGIFSNALQVASLNKQSSIIKLLLDRGADINTQGGHYGNALQAASLNGHLSTIKLLLNRGADIITQGGFYGNALQAASSKGHLSTVKLLLNRGADINTQGGPYGNALQAASLLNGSLSTVKLLLDRGADINTQGENNGNALQAASATGHLSTVELLLNRGADINAQGGNYGNALQVASAGGHSSTVELLLDRGADINTQGGKYGNALQAASLLNGSLSTVKLLLDRGADINTQGGKYGNALQAASATGHLSTVELLLNRGADINAQGGNYGNALQVASAGGHSSTVELLLDRGADINKQGGFYSNALQAASWNGHSAIVELLQSKGARGEEFVTRRKKTPAKMND